MRFGIVAGELSGDLLGAGLMRELRKLYPEIEFEGIGGQLMLAEGMRSYYPLEKLSVMGLVEVLRHLPELLAIRRNLVKRFLRDPPSVFIGIDAPDFNLGLEQRLRDAGIPTVHYVSPTVWAWRQGRVKKIRRAIDLMLSIFPFEAAFFEQHNVPVTFVGHPLADDIPLVPDRAAARHSLHLPVLPTLVVAVLPGSRMSEVRQLGLVFLDTIAWLIEKRPAIRFVIPCATTAIHDHIQALLAGYGQTLPVDLVMGRSRECMTAANAVLLASGTATLEAMLHQRPMVVAYRVSAVTGWLAKYLVKVPYFAMPNLIAQRKLVEEFAQDAATVDNLGPAMLALLDDKDQRQALMATFRDLHQQLSLNANLEAALAVQALVESRR